MMISLSPSCFLGNHFTDCILFAALKTAIHIWLFLLFCLSVVRKPFYMFLYHLCSTITYLLILVMPSLPKLQGCRQGLSSISHACSPTMKYWKLNMNVSRSPQWRLYKVSGHFLGTKSILVTIIASLKFVFTS